MLEFVLVKKMHVGLKAMIAVAAAVLFYFAVLPHLRSPEPPGAWLDKTPPSSAVIEAMRAHVEKKVGVKCENFSFSMSSSLFRSKNTRLTCNADDRRLDGAGLETFGREVAKAMAAAAPPELDVAEVCVSGMSTLAKVTTTSSEQACFDVAELR